MNIPSKAVEAGNPDSSSDEFVDMLAKVMDSQQPVEGKLVLTDGRTFLRRVLPYVDNEKASRGIVITLVDITELAHIELR